jgi:hypothetical protein
MAGVLGYVRGTTKCLLCNREHEPISVSFGAYGSVSICPGHPMKLKRTIPTRTKADGRTPRMSPRGSSVGRGVGKKLECGV